MLIDTQISVAFGFGLLLCAVVAYHAIVRRPTIQFFFWGNSDIRPSFATSLMLSSSFSLNGLMYQAILAYQIGYWALLVQAVWSCGYLILVAHSKRVSDLCTKGTLHGIITSFFGVSTGRFAAYLSAISFSLLVGWEIVVGVDLFAGLLGDSLGAAIIWCVLITIGTMWYTINGGIRGDNKANLSQNIIKIIVLVVSTTYLISHATGPGPAGSYSFSTIGQTLGWLGFASNIFFSFFWQSTDMSLWQNIAATSGDAKGRRNALIATSVGAWLFPGLVGTLIGVYLSSQSGLQGGTVLPAFISAVAAEWWLSLALLTAFVMAVLGTVDGFCLSIGQSVSWDLRHSDKVKKLLLLGEQKGKQREEDPDDRVVIRSSRFALVVYGSAGIAALMIFVFGLKRDVFEAVYFVVVFMMALAPLVIRILLTKDGKPLQYGFVSLVLGVVFGAGASIVGMLGLFDAYLAGRHKDLYTLSPIIAFSASALPLAVQAVIQAVRRRFAWKR